MSFDNIDRRFEYVRHGADWQLLKHNLSTIKNLMTTQGHWGGIHAVYNIYNATRICELREFAQQNNTSILWQNLFQPDYLDPFMHNSRVAELAADEIENFYSTGPVTDSERTFFDQALTTYRACKISESLVYTKFCQHIKDNETRYHPDKLGQFAEHWPELEFLCQ
jgi:hypothetical protein